MNRLEDLISRLDMTRLPRHVAMIMDGNGRWAQQRGSQRSEGHTEGVVSVRKVTELSSDLGISFLTLYAFSTENWNRPKEEVELLMHLIGVTIEEETPHLVRNNVKLHLIGDIGRIPEASRLRLMRCVEATAGCTGLTLCMCLSYSSRWELTETVRKLAQQCESGQLSAEKINEGIVTSALNTAGIPDPDLLIRTGGERRISNFLLWQIAYSELYFTPTLWPDFDKEAYVEALLDYQRRERRYGMTSEQVAKENNQILKNPNAQ